ncbi:ribosome maturation factor RimP [Dethiosulfovibrio faecalis]|uniref:ribosome maturation factor RimP n=1 Tax=Dethiosulfovibrio faecalis TaxID=2720018 RepID=UPI002102570A|nr:ribosome maturation factor RimP [Dethiosulfovibrio faecalis]
MEGKNFPKEEIRKIVESLGYEFVGLEVKKESAASFVRVYLDSLGGISVRDCEIVSRRINNWLEESGEDLLDERYYLEVSSPGLERPLLSLDDFRRFSGKEASIRFNELVEGRRRINGVISVSQDDSIRVENEDGVLEFPLEAILSAKLKYVLEKNKKPNNTRKKKGTKKKNKSKKVREEDQ